MLYRQSPVVHNFYLLRQTDGTEIYYSGNRGGFVYRTTLKTSPTPTLIRNKINKKTTYEFLKDCLVHNTLEGFPDTCLVEKNRVTWPVGENLGYK